MRVLSLTSGVLAVALGLSGAHGAQPAYSPCVPEVYQTVGIAEGVPPDILYAVALTESGKWIPTGSVRPYPWTVVVRGAPSRFDTKSEAVKAVTDWLQQGVTNIDVGLMQTNLHWHGYRYPSIEQSLDPITNVRAGAQILKKEWFSSVCSGEWWCAGARYHSHREERGRSYAAKVRSAHGGIVCGVRG